MKRPGQDIDTSKVPFYINYGTNDHNWYEETTGLLIELYGQENLKLVANLLAATSINSSLGSNIRLFRKAHYEFKYFKPFSNYLPNIKLQLNKLRAGKELTGRKIRSFSAALAGDPNAVVVDIWLLRAFGVDKQYMRNTGVHAGTLRSGGATDRQYDQIESWVRDYAFHCNMEPRQVSAAIWSGIRLYETGDTLTRYDKLLIHQEFSMFDLNHSS